MSMQRILDLLEAEELDDEAVTHLQKIQTGK